MILCIKNKKLFYVNDWNVLSLVQTAPEEFEHGVFILKMHQVFSLHTTPREKCKNRSVWVCVEENSSRVSYLFDKHRDVY